VVKTSVTTAVGFMSFALSPLGPVRAFGVFTAAGIIFCMLFSLTAVPAMLVLVNPRRFVVRRPDAVATTPLAARLFARLGASVGRARYVVIVAALAVIAVAPFGLRRVTVQDSWINGFAADSEFYRATQDFNEQFLGTHVLLLRVDTEHEVLQGKIPGADIDHHEVMVPGDVLDDPHRLIDQQIFVLTEAAMRETEAEVQEGNLPKRRRGSWKGLIVGATREGDRLVLAAERRSGSPVAFLRPAPDEMLHYYVRIEPLATEDVIHRIGALESFIEGRRDLTVGGVIGTASYLATTNYMARGLKEDTYVVPHSSEKIRWLWGQYKRIRGQERLQQVVDPAYGRSLVTVFLKNANFVDVQALMDAIRDYERQHLAPQGISVGFAGDVAVSQTLIRAIVDTQVWSLGGSLIGILAIATLMSLARRGTGVVRSLGWGLLSVLPCAVAVLVNFAVMGWTGMPLGVATSMFAGMTLGIGVDYAIHLLERYRLARRQGLSQEEAVADTVAITGPAVFVDAVAVALGFGILTLSQVPANARLGALVVLSIAGCLAATLLLLPALLRLGSRRRLAVAS
jgi:predicted RND superfamily exporter protein